MLSVVNYAEQFVCFLNLGVQTKYDQGSEATDYTDSKV